MIWYLCSESVNLKTYCKLSYIHLFLCSVSFNHISLPLYIARSLLTSLFPTSSLGSISYLHDYINGISQQSISNESIINIVSGWLLPSLQTVPYVLRSCHFLYC